MPITGSMTISRPAGYEQANGAVAQVHLYGSRDGDAGHALIDQSDADTAVVRLMALAGVTPTVYVVRPSDPSEDVAVFANEADAEAFRATFDNAGDVESAIVCDRKLARKMIAERIEAQDPDDENGLTERFPTVETPSGPVSPNGMAGDGEPS